MAVMQRVAEWVPPKASPVAEWVRRHSTVTGWITFGVVAAAVVFTLAQLQPSLLIKNTTPAGGDTGAHVWGPDYLRNHVLTKFRLTGWAPSWYAGFPAYVFYFPLPALLIAFLSFLMPYGVAFKIITISGILTLPIAAWAFGRLCGMRYPGPAVLAVAAVPFLFYSGFVQNGGWSYTIYGGNIASTLAGEFSFSVSLSFALVFLGVFARSLDTGRYRVWAAILLACTGLSHVLPTVFAVVGALVLLALRPNLSRAKLAATVLGIGAMLAAWWSVPFLLRLPYTNNMGWEKLTTYQENLVPGNFRWVAVLALFGAVASIVGGRRTGLFLAAMATLAGLVFVLAPAGKLWNARALPFWYLCVFLLAGVALAEGADLVARLVAADPDRPPRQVILAAPIVVALAAWMYVGGALNVLPRGVPSIPSSDASFLPSWAKWNFSGYEGKTAYPEYKGIIDTMAEVGRTNGCGRAHWEYDSSLDRFGTPMALMLLPYWTDQCIASMEGLYFESSASVPYHFLSAAELAKAPSNPMRNLPYNSLDVKRGVTDLQLLGSRYYLAFSPDAVAQANENPVLREVATTGAWHVYEVAGSELVTPLAFKPAVVTGAGGEEGWLGVAVKWFNDPARREIPLAASGPKDWPRVAASSIEGVETSSSEVEVGSDVEVEPVTPEPVAPTQVRNIEADDNSLSFDVDRVGSPVLVKVSYFPNWKVSGADGPWRVTPNLMVVVPTSTHVRLHYGNTPVDIGGWLLAFTGIGLAVVVRRKGPVVVDDVPSGAAPPPPPPRPAAGPVPDEEFDEVPDGGPRVPVRSGRRSPLTAQGTTAKASATPLEGPLGPRAGP
ncbi:MAG: hypothetical protein H0T70_00165 [Acidimicrobiia bacterium]|nr:hypothetical protein [Acidimicrobiia bacterium]